jgi:hypothetical protein
MDTPHDPKVINAVPIDQAFLSIPDEGNEPIIDARKTFLVTLASAAAFIAIVFIFIL